MNTINPNDFVAWLTTQLNSRGSLYLDRVARQYARYLRTEPLKLDLPLSVDERSVYRKRTPKEFNSLVKTFISAPNYKKINTDGHQTFSSGLKCFARYLEYLYESKVLHQNNAVIASKKSSFVVQTNTANIKPNSSMIFCVDFSNASACSGSTPLSCTIGGVDIPFVGNWRDLIVAITEYCIFEYPEKTEKLKTQWFSKYSNTPFMISQKPVLSGKRISNGYWINVNYSISQLITIIAGLLRFCGISLSDVKITYSIKSTGGSVGKTMDNKDYGSTRFAQQSVRKKFRSWLTEHNPAWSNGTVAMHYSDAYYLLNNECGITLEEALTAADGFQRAYNLIELHFINNPTQTNNPSGSAQGYLRSLRMLKEFLIETHNELLHANVAVEMIENIPESLIESLNEKYSTGFRFDTTYINLLSKASQIEVDECMQSALKRIMFRRKDDIYFLLDNVADVDTRKNIVDFADALLEEYGCFEMAEFYKLYEDKVNPKCIGGSDDFEYFFKQIGRSSVRCVQAPQFGTRIVRLSSGSVWGTFKEVSAKIVTTINDEFYGSINEDDLHAKFCAFSTDLLGKIIKYCASDELICVEINGSVCYQTFDAFGLPEDFSELLAETLECLSDIELEPTQDILHTAISLKLGVNFKAEFNLPDWDTYRRLIAVYYKAEPRREWKYNIFGEVAK